MNSYKSISFTHEGPVWTLTINRPKALNALSSEVLGEMSDVLRQLSEMSFDNARVLIVTGMGEKSFVAGADIKELADLNEDLAHPYARRGQSIFHELNLLNIPVIAAVNGFALGGGCELALACDFIYASEKAKFGLPEVSLGLIPGFGGTVRLSRAVGIRRARELTYSGEMITAEEAFRIGLVNRIFPADQLMPEIKKKVELILSRAPKAVAQAKKSINRAWDMEVEEAQKMEAEQFAELFNTEDCREGTKAFLEGRKPEFYGK